MVKKQSVIFILLALALIFSFVSLTIHFSYYYDSSSRSGITGQPAGNIQLYVLQNGTGQTQNGNGPS